MSSVVVVDVDDAISSTTATTTLCPAVVDKRPHSTTTTVSNRLLSVWQQIVEALVHDDIYKANVLLGNLNLLTGTAHHTMVRMVDLYGRSLMHFCRSKSALRLLVITFGDEMCTRMLGTCDVYGITPVTQMVMGHPPFPAVLDLMEDMLTICVKRPGALEAAFPPFAQKQLEETMIRCRQLHLIVELHSLANERRWPRALWW